MAKMAKAIMVQGTMSNAGKSLLVTGLCRIFAQDGYQVAPFKSQNMALNSYITEDGGEMGRAQVAQAEACYKKPDVRMNPILLKPTTDMGSQVILNGKVMGNMKAMDYYRKKTDYIPLIKEAYDSLARENDIIVIEGAGSPVEINLKENDIVNMGMAKLADANVLLVGDIDRGGVFAQLLGTMELLEPEEKDRVKGLIVNKFRGDVEILKPGIGMLEDCCKKPVVGVVPYTNVCIDDEDSLGNGLHNKTNKDAQIDVAVIRLPKISNYTDVLPLTLEQDVQLRYVSKVSELQNPDLIILPGSKSTMDDMAFLMKTGLDQKIKEAAQNGTFILGICGGYQLLGANIIDEKQVESSTNKEIKALGLLPLTTRFSEEKKTVQTSGCINQLTGCFEALSGLEVTGYEIHMGETTTVETNLQPLISTADGTDGYVCGHILGTYFHGILDAANLRKALLDCIVDAKGIKRICEATEDYNTFKQSQYDILADALRQSLDMDKIYEAVGINTVKSRENGNITNASDEIFLPYKDLAPRKIEDKSFEIIGEELAARGIKLDEINAPVIKRAIHTTADFDYVQNLVFSKDAVKKLREAIMRGACIVTDTQMAKSGINKKILGDFGGEVYCFMSDEDVAMKAKETGQTRAVISMEKAATLEKELIFAIGNAPTALIKLDEMMKEGRIKPAGIIGVPVGFVNVVEAKELIIRSDCDHIVARGRKGGSNVAAAICNALLYGLKRDE